jgi:hypothetical protein
MNADIERAEKHLNDMLIAKTLPEFTGAWQDFLFRLERMWETTKAKYQKEPWFLGFYHVYDQLKRKDPLLKYLKEARNAETHTIEGTLDSPISILVKDKYGRPFQVDGITYTLVNGHLTINIDGPHLLLDYEADVWREGPTLASFRCRGKWYSPPRTHLGMDVKSKSPVVIGKLGLAFCKSFLDEMARKAGKT